MRKSDFRKNHDEFENWIEWYGDFAFTLVNAKRVISRKFEVLEALVLRVATRWENLVEQDIVISLNRDSSAFAIALDLRLPRHPSRDECEAVFLTEIFPALSR